jgi:cephalosporin-C deacetylase-like acetyl esterase
MTGSFAHLVRVSLGAVVALAGVAVAAAEVKRFPAGFSTQEIATDGATIHVRFGGQGPAVVLLHGFGDTGDMWAPVASALAKDHSVVVPDLRGMGLSSHPETGYDKKTQARDVAQVLDRLKIDKRRSSPTTSATWSATPSPPSSPTA